MLDDARVEILRISIQHSHPYEVLSARDGTRGRIERQTRVHLQRQGLLDALLVCINMGWTPGAFVGMAGTLIM